MKQVFITTGMLLFFLGAIAQEKLSLSIEGVTPEAALKMKLNGDRISWYPMSTSPKIASNVFVEISNVGEKRSDRASTGVQADPDGSGLYAFNASVEISLKKVDKTKPLHVEVVVPTVFGNELFYTGDMSFEDLSKPIRLNAYMWRASNEKVQPKKDLCLEFSSFVENAELRKQVSENENFYKFNRNDFSLQLKQEEQGEWKSFSEPFQGGFSNNNAVSLTNPMPSWIDPAKKLFVRFAAKTPLNNYVWAEYSVEPHAYRREQRAQHYSSVAYDVNAKPNLKDAPAASTPSGNTAPPEPVEVEEVKAPEPAPVVKEEKKKEQTAAPVQKEQINKSAVGDAPAVKSKTGGLKTIIGYDELIKQADSLFTAAKFEEAKNKYDEAAKLKPSEDYPKRRSEECMLKLKAIQSKKSRIGTN